MVRLLRSFMAACLVVSVAQGVAAESDALKDIAESRSATAERYADAAGELATELRAKRNAEGEARAGLLDEIKLGSSDAASRDPVTGERLQSVIPYADEARSYLIFVSASMSPGDIRSILAVSSEDLSVHVIFRGVQKDGGVDGFMRWLTDLTRGMTGAPRMTIDPPTWQQYGVTGVPTLIALEHGKEVARAHGIANPEWMAEQLAAHRAGDLGRYGEVVEPSEPDMMVMLKEAAKGFDMAAYRANAERDFWASQKPVVLPMTAREQTRRVDPSVAVTQDVTLPDGKVLAKKGDRINPLRAVAFNQRLIVIDANDSAQRALARTLAEQAGNRRVVILTGSVPDPDSGFASWGQWQDDLGMRLYLLSEQVRSRLDITHTPTMVEADGDQLVLTELVPPTAQPNEVSMTDAGADTKER